MKRNDYALSIIGLISFVGLAILFTGVSADTGSGDASSMMGGPHMGVTGGSTMMGEQRGMGMMGRHQGMRATGMMGGPAMMSSQGMGMMSSRGMEDIPGIGPIWGLDLSDEQRSEAHKIEDGLRKKNWELQGKLLDQSSELRELYAKFPRDPSAIGAVYATVFDVKRQMIEASIEAGNRIHELLTDDQRGQLKQWRHEGGRGCPMGMMGR